MKYFKKLEGKNIYLAPMMVQDAEIYCKWMNDSRVTDGINKTKDITTLENEIEYIQSVNKSDNFAFSIVKKENDELIGSCTIMNPDYVNQRAELGIAIGDENSRGKGYGQEALKLLLNYGFNTLNMHNINLSVFSFNKQAIACYKKVGFKEIGVERESCYHDGKRYDIMRLDILKSEFNSEE